MLVILNTTKNQVLNGIKLLSVLAINTGSFALGPKTSIFTTHTYDHARAQQLLLFLLRRTCNSICKFLRLWVKFWRRAGIRYGCQAEASRPGLSRNPKRWDTDTTLLCPCCCPVFNTITLSIHQLRVKTWTNQPTMNTEHTNHFTTCCSSIMLCMVFSPWTYILRFDFSLKRTCLIPVRKAAWWLVLKCFATTAVAAKTLFPLKGGRKFSTITSAENTLLCHGLGHYSKVWTRNWF